MVDDNEVDYEDSEELYRLLVGSSVFNMNLDCDEPSTVTLRSFTCELSNGINVVLDVEDSSINDSM